MTPDWQPGALNGVRNSCGRTLEPPGTPKLHNELFVSILFQGRRQTGGKAISAHKVEHLFVVCVGWYGYGDRWTQDDYGSPP